MRLSLRRLATIALLAVVFMVSYVMFSNSYHGILSIYEGVMLSERFDPSFYVIADAKLRDQIHFSKYSYSELETFTRVYSNDIKLIKSLPLNKRCQTFFSQYDDNHPDWTFDSFKDSGYEKSIGSKQLFFQQHYEKLREQRRENGEMNPDKITRTDNITINEKYMTSVRETLRIEQQMADTVALLRIYGQCYLNNPKPQKIDQKMYHKFTTKLFPFFNHYNLPIFSRVGQNATSSDDEASPTIVNLGQNKFPIYDSNNTYSGQVHSYDFNKNDNMIDFVHKKSSGKGIVISAASKHARDLIKLLRVLRALNTKLPIQIVYSGDISKKYRKLIEMAATAPIDLLLHPGMATENLSYMPELQLLEQYREYGAEFPPLDLWLVNIVNTIEPSHKSAFKGYSSKLLALIFNSFDEVILMDADTVPFMEMIKFFETPEYQKSGAYFFQDRSLRDHNDFIEVNYFAKLFPNNENSIEQLFDIPLVTEKTMGNKYMKGWRHFQEAGIVVMNKRRHFLGVLMTAPLGLWNNPVHSSVWGDKEMYWIAMAMAGDEDYEFNKYAAASVGELTKNNKYTYYPNTISQELCSTHPGHISSSGKLLWINSGFSFCKKGSYFVDRDKFPFAEMELDSLSTKFSNPQTIRAAIVPPDLPEYRSIGVPLDIGPELRFKESWNHRKPDTDEINKDLPVGTEPTHRIESYGPQKGWIKNGICRGYYYCAYNAVATYQSPESGVEFDHGQVFEFSEQDTRMYDFLSKVWLTGNTRTEPRQVDTPKSKSEEQTATSEGSNGAIQTSETNIIATPAETEEVQSSSQMDEAKDTNVPQEVPLKDVPLKDVGPEKQKQFDELISKLDDLPDTETNNLLKNIFSDMKFTYSRGKDYPENDEVEIIL